MLLRRIPLLLLALPVSSLACEITLSNATNVDLGLLAQDRHVVLGPGESKRLPLAALANIEFGAISHGFQIEAAQASLCKPGKPKAVEARPDGALWLKGSSQPQGLPLRPISGQDLTVAPPNSAFKPNSFRYTNSVAERACHAVCSATRVGLT